MAAPFVYSGEYHHAVLVTFCIHLLLLTGLNLVAGHARQVSLAHAGLYGLGAYAAGIASAKFAWPPMLAFVFAPAAAAIFAAVVGVPSLRLRGLYFSMATLGAGTVLYLVFGRAVALTGGPNGLLGIPALAAFGYRLATPFAIYWLAAGLALLGLAASFNLARSRIGRALRALGISENGAAVVGVDTFRLKWGAFVLSGVYAGCAGALQTFQARFISPETFGFFTTVILVAALTLGGMGTFWGPVFGALLLTTLDERLARYPDLKPLALGVVFVIAVLAFPHGLAGGLERWLRRENEAGSLRARAAVTTTGGDPRP